ncbi:MAG TPA: ATP-binding protein [Gammaproteobacteria bacterium]|nr:ATP-binding protein [Gammaproteobacteria bacterium]
MTKNLGKRNQSKHPLSRLTTQQDEEIEKLEAEIRFLRRIIALMPGHVFWKNTKHIYMGGNLNWAKFLKLAKTEDIMGKRNSDFFTSDIVENIETNDSDVFQGTRKEIEEPAVDATGKPAIYLTQKVPLVNDQKKVVGLLGISFNITERKKLEENLKIAKEQAEASERAKSQFLAIINHELRTPISGMIGLLEMLKVENLPLSEKERIIGLLENSSQHLLGLVNNVLDFSRLEVGKYQLRKTPVNITALIQEIYALTTSLAEKKGLALILDLQPNLSPTILTDVSVLRHILTNLIGNAIKFTEMGHVKIHIKNLKTTATHTRIKIAISDTGYGIAKDKIKEIFKPFQQLDNPYVRQTSRSGTGLGLSIVEKLVKTIGMKIKVTSQVGKGSTFALTGDFSIGEDKTVTYADNTDRKKKGSVQLRDFTTATVKPKILLVEDDPVIAMIHQNFLTLLGCNIDTAVNAQEALKKFDAHDMIFMDLSLPDLSGFDVIKAIRTCRDEASSEVPIIALTAYKEEQEKEIAYTMGASAFITKPVSKEQLQKLLSRYIKHNS